MSAIPSKFDHEHIRSLQMALNEKTKSHLKTDGVFGPQSIAILKFFQRSVNLPMTGFYDVATQALLEPFIAHKYLTATDYARAAEVLGVSVAAIRTVVEVEAAGDGFLESGACVVLFERHKFYNYLSKKCDLFRLTKYCMENPAILNKEPGGYLQGEAEYGRLKTAIALDAEAALMSASWGMFQVMGFNYKSAGYKDVFTFTTAMRDSERNQLNAFVSFIQSDTAMHNALKRGNWTEFARMYNGPKFAINKYDFKLAAAFKTFNTLAA